VAQERNGWEFDSRGNPNVAKPDAQQVHEILLKMLNCWNAHDIEGYIQVYWKTPELLVVVDSEQVIAESAPRRDAPTSHIQTGLTPRRPCPAPR
jgi:hypothetical protein